MTYCVGVKLESGLIFASDSRTHAGTQAVISTLTRNGARPDCPSLMNAEAMFDVALQVSEAMRLVDKRDGMHLTDNTVIFNASFILEGQIRREKPGLFRLYSEGNFIETGYLYFGNLSTEWNAGIRDVFSRLTNLEW